MRKIGGMFLLLVVILTVCTIFDYVRGSNLSKQVEGLVQKEVAEKVRLFIRG